MCIYLYNMIYCGSSIYYCIPLSPRHVAWHPMVKLLAEPPASWAEVHDWYGPRCCLLQIAVKNARKLSKLCNAGSKGVFDLWPQLSEPSILWFSCLYFLELDPLLCFLPFLQDTCCQMHSAALYHYYWRWRTQKRSIEHTELTFNEALFRWPMDPLVPLVIKCYSLLKTTQTSKDTKKPWNQDPYQPMRSNEYNEK